MNTVPDQENKTEIESPPCRPWWKFRLMGWTLALGLILLIVGVLVSTVDLDRRTLAQVVFRLDPRYWPLWSLAVLWGIAAWLACDRLRRFDFVRRNLLPIRIGIIIAVLCWVAWLCEWTSIAFRKRIYHGIYAQYIIGPMSEYQANGTLSWKLLILPTLGIVTIASLLFLAYRQRKKKP